MTTADIEAGASRRRSRRAILGLAAQVLGIAGGVLIILLIVGLWLGRGWLADRGNALTAAADEQVARVVIVSELVSGRLNDAALRVEEYEAEARSIAADTTAGAQRLEALRTRLGPLATRYTDARDQFVAIRERVMSVAESVQRLDRLVPAIELPGTITGALEDFDALLVRLDTALTGLSATGETVIDVNAFATARAEAASNLAGGLRDAQVVVDSMQQGAEDLEGRLLAARSTVGGWIDLSAFGVTLFLLYLVFLHAALWYLGRRLRAD